MPAVAPNRVCVFAKLPTPGAVKTRLAESLGAEKAARLYALLLEAAAATVGGANRDAEPYEAFLCFAPDTASARMYFGELTARHGLAGAFPQSEGDLGARMRACFQASLADGASRVVLVGSDCPDLTPDVVAEAFRRLAAADLVLAPAPDGGYSLIGVRADHPTLFEGIAWSGPTVMATTLLRAASAGLKVAQLDPLDDIDEPADLARLPRKLADAAGISASEEA